MELESPEIITKISIIDGNRLIVPPGPNVRPWLVAVGKGQDRPTLYTAEEYLGLPAWFCSSCGGRYVWTSRWKEETNWNHLREFFRTHPDEKLHNMCASAQEMYQNGFVLLMDREIGQIKKYGDVSIVFFGIYVIGHNMSKAIYRVAAWANREEIESCLLEAPRTILPDLRRELSRSVIYQQGWPVFNQTPSGNISRLWPGGRRKKD